MVMGLTEKASDLDVVLVNATPETVAILERLQGGDESKHLKNEYLEKSKRMYRIMHDGVKIDFFLDTVKRPVFELSNGLLITTIPDTIKAKKSYSRLKDWLQLKHYAEMFCTQTELNAFINKETEKLFPTK